MENLIPATGAQESNYDVRTISHEKGDMALSLVFGGYDYLPEDIDHQHKVGICTAIELTQNAGKVFGKKFSADFQYLLQKKFFDQGWFEGSSIFSSLKVGKNYGFLEAKDFPHVTEADRYLSYSEYIDKLQAISDLEIQRLLELCKHKLTGYASVDVYSPQSIAKGIVDSEAGILCRYVAGSTWWTAKDGRISWATTDIDPLREPTQDLSGHAIIMSKFDYMNGYNQTLANTWGIEWNDKNKGTANINWSNYKMSEAWIPYYNLTPEIEDFTHSFQVLIQYGQTGPEVMALQQALSTLKYFTIKPTGHYGQYTASAVLKFQIDKVPNLSWYERYISPRGKNVGIKTRSALNLLFNK